MSRNPRRCEICPNLKASLTSERGHLADTRQKLIRQQEFDDTDLERIGMLAARIAVEKDRVADAQLMLDEHQAECEVAREPRPLKEAGPRKPEIPAQELLELRAAGFTMQACADHFRVDIHVIRRRLRDLPLIEADQPWAVDALCAQTDPEAFYPEKGGSTREAKSVCAKCTVAAECLTYALEHQERFGIWGGLSERERRRLTRRAAS